MQQTRPGPSVDTQTASQFGLEANLAPGQLDFSCYWCLILGGKLDKIVKNEIILCHQLRLC